jgi:hypothetical protein
MNTPYDCTETPFRLSRGEPNGRPRGCGDHGAEEALLVPNDIVDVDVYRAGLGITSG